MNHYDRLKRKRLGDLLVEEEVASKEAVITALHEHHQSRSPISQILIAGGELREYDLARIVVEQYQLPFLDLASYTYHRDLISEFPSRLLHRTCTIPLDRFGDVVCFACQEFPGEDVVAQLKKHGAETVFFYAAMAGEVRQALHEHVPIDDENLTPDMPTDDGASTEGEDGAWQDLFDTANESVVSGLADSPEQEDATESEQPEESVEAKQGRE